MKLQIKICGLRDSGNIRELTVLPVHFLGFIFHPGSLRYVGDQLNPEVLKQIPEQIKKIGVFVNEETDTILELVKKFSLNGIQLHGNESPEECGIFLNEGLIVIKAFQLHEYFDFSLLDDFTSVCDYFLFDTKTKYFGGSGKKFNWDLLEKYKGKKPFFLSGGIGPGDAEIIKRIKHNQLYALDLNSGFEIDPAKKNSILIDEFLKLLSKD